MKEKVLFKEYITYLKIFHPDLYKDQGYVSSKIKEAEEFIERQVEQGVKYDECIKRAYSILFRNLLFSPEFLIKEVIATVYGTRQPDEGIISLLKEKINGHTIEDGFEFTLEYQMLKKELIETCRLYSK